MLLKNVPGTGLKSRETSKSSKQQEDKIEKRFQGISVSKGGETFSLGDRSGKKKHKQNSICLWMHHIANGMHHYLDDCIDCTPD